MAWHPQMVLRVRTVILNSAPQVDDLPAAHIDGAGRAQLGALGEVAREFVGHRLEPALDISDDLPRAFHFRSSPTKARTAGSTMSGRSE